MHSIQDNYRTEARRAALNKVEEVSIFGGTYLGTGLELSRRTDAYVSEKLKQILALGISGNVDMHMQSWHSLLPFEHMIPHQEVPLRRQMFRCLGGDSAVLM